MKEGIDRKRFQLLDSIFQHAADLPVSERASYLDQACAGDAALRQDVEKLLADLTKAGSFLETPAIVEAARLGELQGNGAAPDSATGQILGNYKVTREIGRGGMGTVFEAVRNDGTFDQRVAIKLIRKGFDTDDIIDRFRRERQILAMVNHPNIGRLLDGGASPDGRPFFVMELIEGQTLMEHCRERKVSLDERLRLFRDICAAVAHAHQNLIIHRDLKPANIMITGLEGQPAQVKLLDFGIAKLVEQDHSAITRAASNLLTPDYASPEQVRGEPVTTATDVYALGLILFELLTGQKAQRASSSALADIERAVCETVPAKPSSITLEGVMHTAAKLRGDLDNIVLKALQKDPQRRYQSVTQFAEDIVRYQGGHPVIARPDSFTYRLDKFVRRNAWGVGVAAALALAVGGGVYSTLRQARIASEHFNSVRSLSKSLLTEIDSSAAAGPGNIKTRTLIAQRSIEYLDKLARNAADDPALMMELADAYKLAGSIQGNRNRPNIGDYEGAMASFRKALDLRRRVEKIKPSLTNRQEIPLTAAEAARVFPGSKESIELAAETVAVAEDLARENPGKFKLALANAHFTNGYLHAMLEEPEAGIPSFDRARELFVEIKRGKNNLAVCDRYVGKLLYMQGRMKDAEARALRALAADTEHLKTNQTTRARMDFSYDYSNLALYYFEQGRTKEAWDALRTAEKLRLDMEAADPGDNRVKLALIEIAHLKGRFLTGSGDFKAGAQELEKVRSTVSALLAKDNRNLEDRVSYAQISGDLARNFRLSGRCKDADELVAQARSLLPPGAAKFTASQLDKLPACASR